MRHVVTVQQIALQRRYIFFRASVFQTDAVVYSCVVHQRVEAAGKANSFVDGLRAVSGDCEFGGDCVTFDAAALEFRLKQFGGGRVPIDDYGNRALRATPRKLPRRCLGCRR